MAIENIELAMTGSGSVGDILQGWTVTEGATPTNATDIGGGTGSVSMSARSKDSSVFVVDNDATITHKKLGAIQGIVGNITDGGSVSGMTIAPTISLLSAERNMPPTGNQPLSTTISSYVAAVTDQLNVSYQATSDPNRVYGGWSGDVWSKLSELCAINKIEIAVSGNTLIVRDIGSTTLSINDSNSVSRTFSTQATGRSIDITCQNTTLVSTLGTAKYNYSQNPSVETNITGWTASNISGFGSFTAARSTEWAANGTASYRVFINNSGSASDPIAIEMKHTIPVDLLTEGESYEASVVLRTSFMNGNPFGLRDTEVLYRWVNGVGGVLATYQNGVVPNMSPDKTYTNTSGAMIKPPGAVNLVIVWQIGQFWYGQKGGFYGLWPNFEGDERIYMDAAILTNGSIVPYFDGSSAGATWGGTANNSISFVAIPAENDFYNAFKDNNTIYSAAAGESITTVIQTKNFPTYLAQPTQTTVLPNPVGTYYISASDNLPVSAQQWSDYGGSVRVAIGEIPGTIELTLTAPPVEIPGVPSPYSLAASDGSSQYATLSIAGTGVIANPGTVNILTGADPNKTTVQVATSLDSPFVINLATAYDCAAWIAVDAVGTATLQATIGTHQLKGFGLTQGSLISYKNSVYRVTSATIGAAVTTITAKWYVTANMRDNLWNGSSAATFDTFWSGYSAGDIQIAPLRK